MLWMARYRLMMFGCMVAIAAHANDAFAQEDARFARWLDNIRAKALEAGISPVVVEDALTGLEPDEEVLRLDRKQPEKKITFTRYVENTVNPRRIAKGRQMMAEYKDELERIGDQYGVQPKYIVALWAIESDFGNNKGNFSVVQSVATLAYDGRRAEFFTKELIATLRLLEAEKMRSDELTGSWAGAMGDCQFMPSTFLNSAVDGNGDGHRDIWNSPPDIFASIANYLHGLKWNPKHEWGRAVVLPDDFKVSEADIKVAKPARHWHARGLQYGRTDDTLNDSGPVPETDQPLYAIYPGAEDEGAVLVTNNFQALLQWNRSRYFATSVGMLADAIGE